MCFHGPNGLGSPTNRVVLMKLHFKFSTSLKQVIKDYFVVINRSKGKCKTS